jgi:hypothetical protein
VHVRRFAANGALLGTTTVAGSGRNEHSSSIARSADGRFSVAYQIDQPKLGGGINSDIRLNRYASGGTLLTTHNIANTSVNETDPEIAMSNAGTTVVVYEHAFSNLDHDIKARKVFSNGALGSTMNIDTDSDYQFNPTVAMDLSDGDFVVAYQRLDNTGTSLAGPNNMIVREMTAGGSLKSTTNLGDRATASLAINASDRYFLGETAFNLSGDPGLGIFAHRGIIV